MKTFFWWKKFEISHFQAVHCVRKNAISPKVFNRFSKTFLRWKTWKIGIRRQKFHGRSYFSFAMVRWKLLQKWKNLKFPNSKLYTVSEKRLYHQRYSTDFQKLFFCWKMWKIGIWAKNLVARNYFSFAMVRWKLLQKEKFEISHFPSCTLCQRKCYITKGIQADFQKLSIRWKTWKIGICVKNFMGAAILVLQC